MTKEKTINYIRSLNLSDEQTLWLLRHVVEVPEVVKIPEPVVKIKSPSPLKKICTWIKSLNRDRISFEIRRIICAAPGVIAIFCILWFVLTGKNLLFVQQDNNDNSITMLRWGCLLLLALIGLGVCIGCDFFNSYSWYKKEKIRKGYRL